MSDNVTPIRPTIGLSRMEQLRRFVAWEREHNPGKTHIAEWALAEIEALREEVAAWRELSDHVRAGACNAIWPDRYTDARTRDVAAALKRAERLAEGYALVPVEPTAAMVNAAANYDTGSSDGTVGRFCAGEIWYLMLAAAPQPPAEAQAQGGGEVVAWQARRTDGSPLAQWEACTREAYEATVKTGRYLGFENGPTGEARPLYAHQPPSAPVGVEGLLADLETIWHSVSDDKETNAAYQRLKAALSQQPAAVECPHRTRCDCLCSCKYGMAGDGAIAAQQGGES